LWPYRCTCRFNVEATTTDTKSHVDFTITEVDGALRVKDVSETVREAVHDHFSYGFSGYLLLGVSGIASVDALHTATVLAFDPKVTYFSIAFKNDLVRLAFMTMTAAVCLYYLSTFHTTQHLQFFNQDKLQHAQHIRRSATVNTLNFLLTSSEHYNCFHDGELLRLMILAKDQLLLNSPGNDNLKELDKLFSYQPLSDRLLQHQDKFWIPLVQEWHQKKNEWSTAMEVFNSIDAKVQELLGRVVN